ncbi:hypothetical protein FACS1894200_08970 [Spirochaetia bacterium]|nr:hypothetical protein FACS1894200_08970 [Spirochaetia bacterium]
MIWFANDREPIIWCERIVPLIGLEKADEIRIWHENLVAAIGREDTVAVIGREYLDPAKVWLMDNASLVEEDDVEEAWNWLAELEKRLSVAAIVAEADGFEWIELDGGVSIVRYIGSDKAVPIPGAIGGKAVIGIADRAFSGRSDLVNCVIPPSVTYIGAWAFSGCTGIQSIIIPSSVIHIGMGALSGCYRLSRAVIPAGLTRIEDLTFFGCMSLLSIVIPEGITHIGERAFSYCVSLSSLTIPKSVTSIGDWAFAWDRNITDINIENDAAVIGKYAFSGWRSLPVEKVNVIKSRFNEKVFHVVLSGNANQE